MVLCKAFLLSSILCPLGVCNHFVEGRVAYFTFFFILCGCYCYLPLPRVGLQFGNVAFYCQTHLHF